jgi:hypothetical protein
LGTVLTDELEEELITEIKRRLEETMTRLTADTKRSEELVTVRVGEAIRKDTDQDGITDYDEVHLYGTDPFSADTDGDGFTDGAEILNGYDPIDDTSEALIGYESPRESGLVRDDYLRVESITNDKSNLIDGEQVAAFIQGKGLPNSFVTLYIFSTPIVVTVKTNDDGSWSYRFDKELPDGTHEVYVGITDNAGRIVAKSNPFEFIKTAEAFSPIGATNEATIEPAGDEQVLFSDNIMLVVLSIAVVALGLVLMLLGLHMQSRNPMSQIRHA